MTDRNLHAIDAVVITALFPLPYASAELPRNAIQMTKSDIFFLWKWEMGNMIKKSSIEERNNGQTDQPAPKDYSDDKKIGGEAQTLNA